MFNSIWETIKANKKGIITKTLVGAGALIGTAFLANYFSEDKDDDELEDCFEDETDENESSDE